MAGARRTIDDAALQAAVERANATLPDYARVGRWVRGRAAFDARTGLATANGRPQPRRHRCAACRCAAIDPHPFHLRPNASHELSTHDLLEQTDEARHGLLATPIIQGCLRGEVSLPSYLAFLSEAFHHVRHTVPLLQACKAALPPRASPGCAGRSTSTSKRKPATTSGSSTTSARAARDAEAVRAGLRAPATEVMVAYAYDTIARATRSASSAWCMCSKGPACRSRCWRPTGSSRRSALPDAAFSYLRSHGTLDREHIAHFAALMDRHRGARRSGRHRSIGARMFYRLYGDVFRSLPLPDAAGGQARRAGWRA